MDDDDLDQIISLAAERIAREYQNRLAEMERRNDLIIGALRRALSERDEALLRLAEQPVTAGEPS